MKYELCVRFGEHEDLPASLTKDLENVKYLDLIDMFGKLGCGVEKFIQSLGKHGGSLEESAVDLLVVALAVDLCDKSFSRRETYDRWTRDFSVYIPVSDPTLWKGVAEHLSKMLKFLTGDSWSFKFRPRPDKHGQLAKKQKRLNHTEYNQVSLFSGGLDSLIGAINLISDGRKPLLIAHYWDVQTASAQEALCAKMKKKFGRNSFGIVSGRIGANKAVLEGAGSENTQRSRSFLFYSMAAAAAAATQRTTDAVLIPENGLIALNVPLDRVRLGALSTRTTHPHFIGYMNSLVTAIGVSADFSNPYRFKTKGEMAAKCADRDFLFQVSERSMSCSSPGKARWQKKPSQHCGYCVPCLIRRAALLAGLLGKDPTIYLLQDLREKAWDSRKAKGRDIRSFLFASRTIMRAPRKAKFFVRKPGPLPADDVEKYARMYRRGMAEVAKLLKGVRSGGG